ncbi:VWA domain-containing protein [Ramlibacter sp. USB13]|uniref:VWA domain-containing protein n=1 Tax=Ramlibacter cellulosilyticus TaxID=2764187 RepID=A0A923MM54_9BURK|nr:VWA domain-containing protein [Ramlibacter cellulosilyticus]MBC5781311.1 VWA domain-containing protein [Ramlibacter cellulosilyticus]
MFFLWPQTLWLMLALPLLPTVYVWLLRRRRKAALRYSSVAVPREAAQGRAWRRHVPPALFFLALCALLFGVARPVARVPLPWARSSVMLAIDISLSMRVTDVKPTRLVAAQEGAKLFLRELPKDVEVGLVTFAGSSQVAQRATLDREALVAAIDGFQMQMGTAVGNAIVLCLAELFPDHGIDVGEMTFGGNGKPRGRSLDEKGKPGPKQVEPVAPGSYAPAAIILLSDGRRTTGIDTLEAAKMAADRGVRVYVIGLGTVMGDTATPEGIPIYMQLDEPTLREVARMTGGEYHHAATAETLRSVYANLGSQLQVVKRETELTALAALVSAVLMVVAGTLSVVWFRRLT